MKAARSFSLLENRKQILFYWLEQISQRLKTVQLVRISPESRGLSEDSNNGSLAPLGQLLLYLGT